MNSVTPSDESEAFSPNCSSANIQVLENFRAVYPSPDDSNDRVSPDGVIFRSAKVNVQEKAVVQEVESYGIRSLIDFGTSSVEKQCVETIDPVDEPVFVTRRVVLTSSERYTPGEELVYEEGSETPGGQPVRYTINVFSSIQMVWNAFTRVAWYYTVAGFFLLICDLILWTNWKYFISLCFHIEGLKGGLVQLYKDILDGGHKGLCAALKILSDKRNYPIVISCAAGKDRTGLVSALVQHCLGMSKEYIIEDYSRSQAAIDRMTEKSVFVKVCKLVGFPKKFQTAKAETMRETLQYLEDKYGSITDYLEYIGFTREDQERLRKNVLSYKKNT